MGGGGGVLIPIANDDVIHEQPFTGIIIFYLSEVEESQ